MEVILIKDMKQKGRLGDRIQVKLGYARNYLIPNGFAIAATAENTQRFETLKKKELKRLESQKGDSEKTASALNGKSIKIEAQTHKGTLYGSVTPSDIQDAIKEQLKQDVDKTNLDMPAHIKEIGKHTIPVLLHPDIECVLKLTIKSSSEVEEPTDFSETEEGKITAEANEKAREEQVARMKEANEAAAAAAEEEEVAEATEEEVAEATEEEVAEATEEEVAEATES